MGNSRAFRRRTFEPIHIPNYTLQPEALQQESPTMSSKLILTALAAAFTAAAKTIGEYATKAPATATARTAGILCKFDMVVSRSASALFGTQVRLNRESTEPKGLDVAADERQLVSELSHE